MILIYTEKITNRIKYIFHLIFDGILYSEISLTNNLEEFQQHEGIKISYGREPIADELFFASINLLFERGISHHDLVFIEHRDIPVFFPVYHPQSALPFDYFAFAFYMVSRYEEYLPYKKDEYGRFGASESIAYQKGFLNKPVVNILALELKDILTKKYPDFNPKIPGFQFTPTIDIDAAWAYRQKGLFRTLGGYAASLLRLDFKEIKLRTRVLAGLDPDPFDTYDFLLNIHRKYKLQPIFFILFASYGLNDKNISVRNLKFHTLIKSLADYAKVGIHPSYNSNLVTKKLRLEIEQLTKVLNREVTKSRQHFLMLRLPSTYRNLINLDIRDDYSMGFASQPGFRAGICSTFNFYDLDLDAETKLRVHPFTFMEGTLRDYMNLDAEAALKIIRTLIKEVKDVNGTFIPIWHNESLSDKKRWAGWQNLYTEMIKMATS
ncbi:MAG: polysaccharide deacetylase family protein [Bacteroidales bacterium]|nr:polysaccharide deacetylase family protein [Bacteroidales bacterium]MCF8403046.1 polysaccharide deacetylase family protein [Bacteroidales bacterium]